MANGTCTRRSKELPEDASSPRPKRCAPPAAQTQNAGSLRRRGSIKTRRMRRRGRCGQSITTKMTAKATNKMRSTVEGAARLRTGVRKNRRRPEGECQEREPQRERPVIPRQPAALAAEIQPERSAAADRIARAIAPQRTRHSAEKLRHREDDRRRKRRTFARVRANIVGEPTQEELARLNQQLEARNAELQARITISRNTRNIGRSSTGAMTGEPVKTPARNCGRCSPETAGGFRGFPRARKGVKRPRGPASTTERCCGTFSKCSSNSKSRIKPKRNRPAAADLTTGVSLNSAGVSVGRVGSVSVAGAGVIASLAASRTSSRVFRRLCRAFAASSLAFASAFASSFTASTCAFASSLIASVVCVASAFASVAFFEHIGLSIGGFLDWRFFNTRVNARMAEPRTKTWVR